MSSGGSPYSAARLLAGVCRNPLVWIGLAIAVAAPACAATDTATASNAAVTEVGGIVITAEHRDTKLQETPLADTAITAATIENNRIQRLDDVAILVPNLTFTQFSAQESYFSIRGTLINNNAAGWDDAVATFIDDVPTTGLGDVNPDLFDLSSIEVLRGPQGTLFGRNATGGAVIIRTAPPSFDPKARFEGTYGSDNQAELRGLFTGPLSSSVAGKLVFDVTHRDDYINNVTLHDKTGGINIADVRGQLLWNASSTVSVLLSADYLIDRSGGYPTRLLGNFTPELFPTLSYSPYDTNQAINGYQHRDIAGLAARITWESPVGTLTSISGYRYVDAKFPNTVLGDPENQLPTVGLVHDTQFSEEVRLASPAEQRLTWVVGLFALHSDKREGGPLGFFFDPNTVAGFFGTPPNDYTQTSDQKVATDSFAAFGEGNYALTQMLKLTLGVRLSTERKSGRSTIAFSIVDPALFPADSSYAHTWNSVTPKVTLSYQPNTHFMAYVTATEGFKSGGYDLAGSGPAVNAALATPFNPETVWNYEIGEKFTGFDNRLVLDADAFDDEYRDLQTSQLKNINNVPTVITADAGNARVDGVEVESSLLATDWLTLGATFAYMDSHFTSHHPDQPPPDIFGNWIPYAPKDQVHLSADIHHAVGSDRGMIDFGIDYTYHSKVFFDNANSAPPFLQQKSVWNGIVNAHLDYVSEDKKWKVSAWGKNITGAEPVLHAADVTVLFQDLNELFSGNPESVFLAKYYPTRTFGVTVTRNF
ncbi:MAG: TonB-dependent receptor [Caulobacterales bacterium]